MAIATTDLQNIIEDAKTVCDRIVKPITTLEFRQRVNDQFVKREPSRNLREPEFRVALEWLIQGQLIDFTIDRKIYAKKEIEL